MNPRDARTRVADVERIVEAARRVHARRAALVPAIVESTGLSPEGVERAFERHLELTPSDEELVRLVERARDAERVSVVLSANVFVSALRAMALARAASNDIVVRPSRRDPVFARALVEAIGEVGDRAVRLDEGLDVASIDGGELHVYGSDATIADVRAKVRANVVVRGHGSGMGMVLLSEDGSLDASAMDLSDDVVAFDQRGCLSPRIVVVVGDHARATAFAEKLHHALEIAGRGVPRGVLPSDVRAESARYVSTMTFAGAVWTGAHHAVAVAPPSSPLVLPPDHRHVHVVSVGTRDALRALLAPLARGIVNVGSDDLEFARAFAPRWARVSRLGWMQRPPLDGPVDLRSG